MTLSFIISLILNFAKEMVHAFWKYFDIFTYMYFQNKYGFLVGSLFCLLPCVWYIYISCLFLVIVYKLHIFQHFVQWVITFNISMHPFFYAGLEVEIYDIHLLMCFLQLEWFSISNHTWLILSAAFILHMKDNHTDIRLYSYLQEAMWNETRSWICYHGVTVIPKRLIITSWILFLYFRTLLLI